MEAMPFLSLVNVKYVLSLGPVPPPLELVYDKEIKIYKNPESFSRAFLVHQVETVQDGAEALERVMALGPELKRVAVIEGPLPEPVLGRTTAGAEERTENRVKVISYTARQSKSKSRRSPPASSFLKSHITRAEKLKSMRQAHRSSGRLPPQGHCCGSGIPRSNSSFCPFSLSIALTYPGGWSNVGMLPETEQKKNGEK